MSPRYFIPLLGQELSARMDRGRMTATGLAKQLCVPLDYAHHSHLANSIEGFKGGYPYGTPSNAPKAKARQARNLSHVLQAAGVEVDNQIIPELHAFFKAEHILFYYPPREPWTCLDDLANMGGGGI